MRHHWVVITSTCRPCQKFILHWRPRITRYIAVYLSWNIMYFRISSKLREILWSSPSQLSGDSVGLCTLYTWRGFLSNKDSEQWSRKTWFDEFAVDYTKQVYMHAIVYNEYFLVFSEIINEFNGTKLSADSGNVTDQLRCFGLGETLKPCSWLAWLSVAWNVTCCCCILIVIRVDNVYCAEMPSLITDANIMHYLF